MKCFWLKNDLDKINSITAKNRRRRENCQKKTISYLIIKKKKYMLTYCNFENQQK